MKKSSRSILAVSFTIILVLFSEHDYMLEMWQQHKETGSLTVVIIGLYTLIHRIIRNHKYDARDAAIFHNQKILMQSMGVSDQWRGPPRKLRNADLQSFKKYYLSSRKAINRGNPQRRMKMNVIRSTKFWLAIIGAIIPVINSEFGLNLDGNTILGILGLFATAIAGIAHVDAKKAQNQPNGGTTNESSQRTGDSGPAV